MELRSMKRWIRLVAVLVLSMVAVVGCFDGPAEYHQPTDAEKKPSSHPALQEKVADAPAVDPHARNPRGANPHGGGLPAGHPSTGGGARGGASGFAGQGKPVPEGWTPGDEFEVAGLIVKAPADWTRERTQNNMREAQFKIAHVDNDGHDGEFWISRAVGQDMARNLARWQGQFEEDPEPKVEQRNVPGFEVILIDLAGTFRYKKSFTAPAEPRQGYRALIAMVDKHLFLRLIAPEATVEKHRAGFLKMIDTIRPAR
jgi:hypothetical protein